MLIAKILLLLVMLGVAMVVAGAICDNDSERIDPVDSNRVIRDSEENLKCCAPTVIPTQ